MTQPPYVPPRDDDNTTSSDYTWPPAQETTNYGDPVSSVSLDDDYYSTGQQSTKDVAKDQAGTVKDTAVDQGQQVAGVAKEQAGAVKDTAVQQGQHVAGVAKEQVGAVKDTAVQQGQHVAEVAKDQVTQVASEATSHVKDLLSEGLTEVRSQAGSQQKRLATGIHSLAGELGSMASKSDQSGPLTDLAKQASEKGGEVAHWLENAEPSELLDVVRSYARRRPGAFLGISALAGVLAGRLTRGFVANAKSESAPALSSSATPQRATGDYTTTGQSYATADYGVQSSPARENISMQEIPTAGSGYGGTTDAPDYLADDATMPYGTSGTSGTGGVTR